MKFRVWILVAMVALFVPSLANAAVCTSLFPTAVDGRIPTLYYNVPAFTINGVYARVVAGHSYSADVSNPFDSHVGPSTPIFFNLISAGDCTAGDTGGTFVNTTDDDPQLYSSSGHRRVSFVAPGSEYVFAVINNTDSALHSYRVQFTDTTLFSPGWST